MVPWANRVLLLLLLYVAPSTAPGSIAEAHFHRGRRPAHTAQVKGVKDMVHEVAKAFTNIVENSMGNNMIKGLQGSGRIPYFGFARMGPQQEVTESHPTEHETKRKIKWPVCLFNRAVLLGTFCVDKTTQLMEKDPANMLPRISFYVDAQTPSSPTVFLISEEDGGFQSVFRSFRNSNSSAGCESVMQASTATIFGSAGTGVVADSRALRGSKPTTWYAVAVDCSKPQPTCPNISEAVLTLYHPNSNAEPDTCRIKDQGPLGPLLSLRDLMLQMYDMPWPNALDVIGVGPFGVVMVISLLALLVFILLAVLVQIHKY